MTPSKDPAPHYSQFTPAPETPTNYERYSNQLYKWLGVTEWEVGMIFRFPPNPAGRARKILYLVGIVLTPITLAGALWGYVHGFRRFKSASDEYATLVKISPIIRLTMILGAVFVWLLIIAVLFIAWLFLNNKPAMQTLVIWYVSTNLLFSFFVFGFFHYWRISVNNDIVEGRKFGSARFAEAGELLPFRKQPGIYVGGGHYFKDKGHILTAAGTRGGKGVNLIIPNLLGVGDYQGSWVVIDPKGENAAITARYQREAGRKVFILNPWNLLDLGGQSYNPLDILADKTSIHLVDDAQMLAEMLIPVEQNSSDKFFTDNARAILCGLILFLAVSEPKETRTLKTLWLWARLVEKEFDDLIIEMKLYDEPVNGVIVQNAANEILKLQESGAETFGSIWSTVLQATDFLKSPALQKALESGYTPSDLSDGNSCVYVIIPADKLRSHSRWLRLVVTSLLRSVIRKPNKRVTFLLDEFAALGYLPEIEIALSTYAGYEVTIWAVLQSLIQLQDLYKANWESFVANSAVRQFFNINDNFSAEYVAEAIGKTSNVITSKKGGETVSEVNERYLVTPDELRRSSARNIFTFLPDIPATYFAKQPYYMMGLLDKDGKNRDDENPYL